MYDLSNILPMTQYKPDLVYLVWLQTSLLKTNIRKFGVIYAGP